MQNPIPKHLIQILEQQHARGRCLRLCPHPLRGAPWLRTFQRKLAIYPLQDGCVHISGIRTETYPLQDRRHRMYICPFCPEIRNCLPAGIAAHRKGTRRNNNRNLCTSLSSATQPLGLSDRNNPPDKLLCKARRNSAYMQQRLSALLAFRLGW